MSSDCLYIHHLHVHTYTCTCLLPYSGKLSQGSIFTDGQSALFHGFNFHSRAHSHHYVLYNQTIFMGLTFVVRQSSAKIAKTGPLKISRHMIFQWSANLNCSCACVICYATERDRELWRHTNREWRNYSRNILCKVSLALPTLLIQWRRERLPSMAAIMAALLLADRGHTHQLIACKRACMHIVVVTT